jgi:NDP-sugar pyrophosphorylase family protein
MLNFSSQTFFSLEEYSHSELFAECEFVWEALLSLSSFFDSLKLGNIETDVPSSAHLVKPSLIYIGPRTIIEPGAYIEGPCFIDSDCQIRQGAYVRGKVITGKHCVIGHSTEIKHSILFNHCSLAHFNYVGDSILGNRVNLGAGTKCANLRLDRETVKVSFQGKKIDTRLE